MSVDVGAIIEYENGNLDEAATISLFQELVNDGTIWNLQGSYGRTAVALLAAGLIVPPEVEP